MVSEGGEYRAAVVPDQLSFTIRQGEAVLDAALRQGIPLKYGCRHGNCSTCKYLLLDGEVDFGIASPYSLSDAERDEGWALLCCATPLTDVEIQDDRRDSARDRPLLQPEERTMEVQEVGDLGGGLWALRGRLDRCLEFYPGQFLELGVPGTDGQWRSYSIASAPVVMPDVEFVVKRIPGGAFSGGVESLPAGTELRARGPYGTAYLRDGTKPVLLAAIGSGVSPVLSILRHAAAEGDRRAFQFLYGARTRADLVAVEEMATLAAQLDLTFTPVLSQPTSNCRWNGPTGHITQAILRQLPDASPYDAYLCGKPEMCETVGALLEAKGIDPNAVFVDRFFPAVEEIGVAAGLS